MVEVDGSRRRGIDEGCKDGRDGAGHNNKRE